MEEEPASSPYENLNNSNLDGVSLASFSQSRAELSI